MVILVCIPFLLWHKNHIYFKSVFTPFMDISQCSVAKKSENVDFEDDDFEYLLMIMKLFLNQNKFFCYLHR